MQIFTGQRCNYIKF